MHMQPQLYIAAGPGVRAAMIEQTKTDMKAKPHVFKEPFIKQRLDSAAGLAPVWYTLGEREQVELYTCKSQRADASWFRSSRP